jgi:hypothetical protein
MSAKPPELSFLDGLSQEQIVYAVKIAQAAQAAGVPPKLAVAIAYQESRLNPNAPNGADGEIGIMQIKPATAKGEGFDAKQIKDPDKNIEAGISYLKKSWERSDQNPKLAAYGYNAGIDAALFYGGDPVPSAKKYVADVGGYGAYTGLIQEKAPEETLSSAPTLEDAPPPEPAEPDASGATPGERFLAGAVGTGVGTAASAGKGLFAAKDARSVRLAQLTGAATERGRLAALAADEAAKAGNPPSKTPLQRIDPTLTNTGDAKSARILRGGEGSTLGTSGRARQEGYSIETAQRAASKDAAQELSEFMKKSGMTETDARRYLAGQPGLTSTEHGVLYPRSEARPTLGARTYEPAPIQVQAAQSGGLPIGSGEVPKIGGANPPPPPPPPPPAPLSMTQTAKQKAVAGLDAISDVYKSMIKPVAATAMKYVGPPAAGLSASLDLAEISHEYQKPEDQRDYIKMGTKGFGALGGALSMFPGGARAGVPMMLTAEGVDAYRNPAKRAYIEQKIKEMQEGAAQMQQGAVRQFQQVPQKYKQIFEDTPNPMGYPQ